VVKCLKCSKNSYDALKEVGASEEKAQAAARAIASYEPRFARIESDISLLKWMLGMNHGVSITMLFKMFT